MHNIMKLNLKDKKLLYWLDQDSRATNKYLGKKVGLSEQAIGYKLKRMEEEGIIKKYITFINTPLLGYLHYKVFLRLRNTNVMKEKEIIDFLVSNTNIRWVVTCSGKWDVSFSTMAKNSQDFTEIYRDIESKIGDYISEKSVFLLIKSPGLTKGYLINQKGTKIREYGLKTKIIELDQTDKNILNSISQNSRKSVVEIADEINSTIDIVRYRLKKLEKEGVVTGYTLQLGYDKLGILRYSVFFSLHKMNSSIEEKMFRFASTHNNIIFMLTMIGTHDLSLELEVLSYEELEKIIKKFREEFTDNINNFDIIFNTQEYKYDFYPFKI